MRGGLPSLPLLLSGKTSTTTQQLCHHSYKNDSRSHDCSNTRSSFSTESRFWVPLDRRQFLSQAAGRFTLAPHTSLHYLSSVPTKQLKEAPFWEGLSVEDGRATCSSDINIAESTTTSSSFSASVGIAASKSEYFLSSTWRTHPIFRPLLLIKYLKHQFCCLPLFHHIALCEVSTFHHDVSPPSIESPINHHLSMNLPSLHPTSTIDTPTVPIPDLTDVPIPAAFSSTHPFPSAADDSTQPELDESFITRSYHSTIKSLVITAKLTQLVSLAVPFALIIATWKFVNLLRSAIERSLSSVFSSSTESTKNDFQALSLRTVEQYLVESIWRYFYWAVSSAGPCYIKFIQWAGTRSDLFPSSWCFRFAKFHWNVTPHPYPYTARVLKETFGSGWQSRVWIDPKSVGAGCIAQVYRGVMIVDGAHSSHPDNLLQKSSESLNEDSRAIEAEKMKNVQYREVALKVVHPHTAQAMRIDIDVMQLVATFIDFLPRVEYLAVGDTVKQFRSLMLPQLDMKTEATSLERFHQNLSRPWSRKQLRRLGTRVIVPRVFKEHTTENLLVESYEEGMVLGQWMRMTSKVEDMKSTVRVPTEKAEKKEGESEEDTEWSSKGFFLRYLEDSKEADPGQRRQHRQHHLLASRPTMWEEFVLRLPHLFETGRQIFCDQVNNIRVATHDILAGVYHRIGIPYYDLKADPTEAPDYGMKRYWKNVAHAGLAFFLQMVFIDNFVHADLHPGNLIIRFRKIDKTDSRGKWERRWDCMKDWIGGIIKNKGRVEKSDTNDSTILTHEELEQRLRRRYSAGVGRRDPEPSMSNLPQELRAASLPSSSLFIGDFNDVDFEIVLLDCGLTTSLSVREYCNFTDLLRCICVGDGYTAGKLVLERARKEACDDIGGFCQEVDDLVQIYHTSSGGSLKLGETRLGEVLSRMLRVACVHRVELDPRFASLIVAIIVLEGVGRQLDPNIDLLRAALPYAKEVLVDATVGRSL